MFLIVKNSVRNEKKKSFHFFWHQVNTSLGLIFFKILLRNILNLHIFYISFFIHVKRIHVAYALDLTCNIKINVYESLN